MRGVLALFFWLVLVGCQTQPTKVTERHQLPGVWRPQLNQPLTISDKTIVIDAREAFNHSLAHIRRSVNLDWREFSQREFPYQGLLNQDLYFHSRRLARLGIAPDSEVIIIGKGREGEGQEGRLAWTLFYMGIENVRYAAENHFKIGWVNTVTEERYPSVPSWQPQIKPSILADRREVLETLKENDTVLLDVRSASEYLTRTEKNSRTKLPELGEVHVEWKEFFTEDGRPNEDIVKKLQAIGIGKNRRIIAISNQGVRSAAVTMALLDLGFLNAANYAGGYAELMAQ